MRVIKRQNDIKFQCATFKINTGYDCNGDFVFEKDIADAVLSAFQQQVALAEEARKKLEAKAKQLIPSIEKLQAEVIRLQKLIDKSGSDKMLLWEKYHTGEISAERFQRENEKADEQAARYTVKIPELQTRIREIEMDTGRENVFVERFSKSNREIGEELGLKVKQIKNLINRHNRCKSKIEEGIIPRPQGRPRKDNPITENEKDYEVKRLRMENKVLRDFLFLAGRM